MPGRSCHCNATATHVAPVRTQHASFTGTSTYAQKSWGGHPRCDLAPLTTSFGTVGQWERQHLAMAGARHHHHSPRNATAHRAARANYHVPLWRSGLAVPASCWGTRVPEGFRRMSSCAAVFPAYRRSRLFAVVFTRAFQCDCALRGFCSSSTARAHHAGTGSLQDFHDFLGFIIFSRGLLRHFSLARDDY